MQGWFWRLITLLSFKRMQEIPFSANVLADKKWLRMKKQQETWDYKINVGYHLNKEIQKLVGGYFNGILNWIESWICIGNYGLAMPLDMKSHNRINSNTFVTDWRSQEVKQWCWKPCWGSLKQVLLREALCEDYTYYQCTFLLGASAIHQSLLPPAQKETFFNNKW